MKRKLIFMFACFSFFIQAIHAQDIITKRNGDDINAKVTEVSADYVKYKKFEYLTGPDYTISSSEVFMIKYENKRKDVFEKNPATGKIQIRHVAAEKENEPQQQPVERKTPDSQAPASELKPANTITSQTPTSPVPPAKSFKSGEYDVVELLENNIVEVKINGEDITQVNLQIRRLVPYEVNVRIPVGSFFVSENPSAQNMVATGEKTVRLTTGNWQTISIPAACANRPKDIPGNSDKFSIRQSPNQAELARLMPVLNKAGAEITVKQAAVWIITDNADYADLGILRSSPGNTRAIGPEATARAMKICAEAGIDITKKNIWRDRETIISGLPAGELKNWLKNFELKTAAAQIQSTSATTSNPGKELIERYSACQQMKPEDNKIGFTIKSISKEEGNSFFVQWQCKPEIMNRNSIYVAVLMYFIDPDDPDNIKNGIASEFRGSIGNHDKMVVTLDKPAKFVIIYFEGIDKSIPNSTQFITPPLFFIAELGDNPKLLEQSPRYAGDLFKQTVEKQKKK